MRKRNKDEYTVGEDLILQYLNPVRELVDRKPLIRIGRTRGFINFWGREFPFDLATGLEINSRFSSGWRVYTEAQWVDHNLREAALADIPQGFGFRGLAREWSLAGIEELAALIKREQGND